MNAPLNISARCLGGGLLQGGKLVRIAYLDEAGLSNPLQEPYLVVAGIILHADEHWRPLEEHLRSIGTRYLPDERKPLFHAKDIFHGTGLFDRVKWPDRWPRARRWELLSELCEIPRKFELPVVFGYSQRERLRKRIMEQYPSIKEAKAHQVIHADAFTKAVIGVESWMRLSPNRNESVMIIAEDSPKIRGLLKFFHSGYTDRYAKVSEEDAKIFHSNHIIDTVHFAAKRESMPLQIADACAFVIKRYLMEKPDSVSFFDVLRPQLAFHEDHKFYLVQSY